MDGKIVPTTCPRCRSRFTRLFILASLVFCHGLVVAQTTVTAPENPVAEPPNVTTETIEAIKKQAAESTDLADDAKQKIETATTQALEGLKRIGELNAQSERFKRDADTVQQRVATLRQQFDALQGQKPSPPLTYTLPELEQEISQRELNLADLKASLAKLEAEPTNRVNRRREIRSSLLSASQRLADIQTQLETPAPADEPPLATAARRAELQVRRKLIEAEQPALQNELSKYDAEDSHDLLRIERDVRVRQIALATAELESLQAQLARQRAADSAAALQAAIDESAATPELLKPFAEENIEFARAADALSLPIEETHAKLEKTKARLEEVQKQFADTRQRVNEIGLTGSIGALLRRQRVALPDVKKRQQNLQARKTLIEDMQYQLFDYNDLRAESVDAGLQRIFVAVPAIRPGLELEARRLLEKRREYLDDVIRRYNTYLDTLFELDATEQRLIRETEEYEDYIEERVLWIRSNRPIFSKIELDASDHWVLDRYRWMEVLQFLLRDIRATAVVYAIALFAFTLLVWHKPRFRKELEQLGQTAERGTCTEFYPTFRAGFLTLMLAITWPGFLLFLGWRLQVAANGSQLARAAGQALYSVAWLYFPLELLRRTCRPHGLADSHFDWPQTTITVLRQNVNWAMLPGLFIVLVTSLMYAIDPEHSFDLVERLFFTVGMVLLAVVIRRMLRPESGFLREYLYAHPDGWITRLRMVWFWGGVAIPLALAGMTLMGYFYTAHQITGRIYGTFVFIFLVLLVRAFLERLLLTRRRAISIEQARQRRTAEAALRQVSADGPLPQSPEQIVSIEETQLDVAENTQKTQRLIRTGLIAVTLIGLWLIWVDVLPALRFLDAWPVWTTKVSASAETALPSASPTSLTRSPASDTTTTLATTTVEVVRAVTAADIGLAILIGIVAFVCARNIPGLMEITVLQRLPLDNSIRYALTSVTSYAIVLFGVILAFNAISIGWSKVQWLATALTFGLAFGLQEIFANFVAGLILLAERPLRVGDVVTVDDVTGVVARIRIRATTIRNWDRKEYVIPNKDFITGRMLNWTLSDNINRIVINVGVAYGSNVKLAKELLLKICNDHPLILDDPMSVVSFEGFGDNSLSLVVRTFLPDMANRLQVIDELHTTIDQVFREANIEIAFPQRDLHLRSIDPRVWERLREGTQTRNSPGESGSQS